MTRRSICSRLFAFTLAAAMTSPLSAVVINDPLGVPGSVDLGTPHTNIVSLFVPGGFCSGALIDSTHILTARHCTVGRSPGDMSVQFYLDNDGVADAVYGVTAKVEAASSGFITDGNDIAVLRLDAPAPANVHPMRIGADDITGMQVEAVGFGYSGVGSTGATIGFDGRRKAADNVMDYYGAAVGLGGGNILNTDFDNPTGTSNTLGGYGSSPAMLPNEGSTAGGDSGSPLILDGKIYGVLSSGSTSGGGYGDIAYYTGAISHYTMIKNFAPGAKFGVKPSAASNASFNDVSDLDVLNIDFGTIPLGDPSTPTAFDVFNLPTGLTISGLDLLSITGSGDTGVLTTDLTRFVNMEGGLSRSYEAMIDTSTAGSFSASYDLAFDDYLGNPQSMTLNLSGIIDGGTTCAIGDADCDGYVSNLEDIQAAFTNFTGPGTTNWTTPKTRAQGDVHGDVGGATTDPAGHDQDVDNLDIQTMFTNFNPAPDAAADVLGASGDLDPAIPDLIYDPSTGEVVIDWDGQTLISYVLKNTTNSFIPANHTTILLGSFATATSNELSESTSFAEPGVTTRSLGNVLPAGMGPSQFYNLFSVNSIILSLGGPQLPFDLIYGGETMVPEPSTWLLSVMALLGLGLLAKRRR